MLLTSLYWVYYLFIPLVVGVLCLRLLLKFIIPSKSKSRFVVAFFHPYCNAGGGGERVLWCAIQAIQQLNPNVTCAVYTGDQVTLQQLLKNVKETFGVEFESPDNIELIPLKKRHWVEASRYPHFTMVRQSIGSMVLGWEALTLINPHVFIGNLYLSMGKLAYYKIFAIFYGLMGRFADVVMANSTWTGDHIQQLWGVTPHIVYPPCDTTSLQNIPLNWEKRQPIILSIAQFRPEKDHMLQLESFSLLLKNYPQHKGKAKLVLVGSCRGEDDRKRIDALKASSVKLGIKDHVQFEIGISLSALKDWLSRASVGIHTMWCEHFGIGIVEFMAAGVIPIAHNSGGPKSDIVKPGTGYLATTSSEYAEYIHEILAHRSKYATMQEDARISAARFSQENFITEFKNCIGHLII